MWQELTVSLMNDEALPPLFVESYKKDILIFLKVYPLISWEYLSMIEVKSKHQG